MSDLFEKRFENAELIGEGGMGSVFSVNDPRIGRRVAVKVLRPEGTEKTETLKRFQREAQTTGKLEHPSIPPIYEFGEAEDGRPYFALKYLDGMTLQELIEKLRAGQEEAHRDFDFSQRTRIALQLAEALAFAHTHNVIHRDLKPENILLGRYGEVWLLDWGIAGPPSEANDADLDPDRLTEEPTFMGTLQFAAPEQIAGVYSPATDQYGLGAVLYEMFSLQPAHPGQSRMELLTAALNDKPQPCERLSHPRQGRVPREVSVLIDRMLEKKPEDRYSHLEEVVQELRLIASGDINAICPHTLTKKWLHKFGRFLDNHNYWFMPLLMLWLLLPVAVFVYWVSGFFYQ